MKILRAFMAGLWMVGFCSVATAEKLLPNSVICDNKEDLALLDREHLKGLGADKVFEKIKAEVAFYELDAKANQIQLDLALKEEEIRNQHGLRGTSAGKVADLQERQRSGDATKAKAASFLSNCTSSGNAGQTVSVIERKAIAGVLKVRASLHGVAADVWTKSGFVLQE